jgi:hypothetical protein
MNEERKNLANWCRGMNAATDNPRAWKAGDWAMVRLGPGDHNPYARLICSSGSDWHLPTHYLNPLPEQPSAPDAKIAALRDAVVKAAQAEFAVYSHAEWVAAHSAMHEAVHALNAAIAPPDPVAEARRALADIRNSRASDYCGDAVDRLSAAIEDVLKGKAP